MLIADRVKPSVLVVLAFVGVLFLVVGTFGAMRWSEDRANRAKAMEVTRIQWSYIMESMLDRDTVFEMDLRADGRVSWGAGESTRISPAEFQELALRFVEAGFWELSEGRPYLGRDSVQPSLMVVTLTFGRDEVRIVTFHHSHLTHGPNKKDEGELTMKDLAEVLRGASGYVESLARRGGR